jgi:hypothetical protein
MTLADFLLARIAEDEAVARAVPEVEPKSSHSIFTSLHEPTGTVEISPARVLAECEAKRRAIEAAWQDQLEIEGEWGASRPIEQMSAEDDNPAVIEALAAVYADHPDYRDEWRPRT